MDGVDPLAGGRRLPLDLQFPLLVAATEVLQPVLPTLATVQRRGDSAQEQPRIGVDAQVRLAVHPQVVRAPVDPEEERLAGDLAAVVQPEVVGDARQEDEVRLS